jgi:hypothetical protein
MLDETRQIEVVELEQALLGRLILNPDQVATASGILPEGAFVERPSRPHFRDDAGEAGRRRGHHHGDAGNRSRWRDGRR